MKTKQIPDLMLEKYVLEELPDDEMLSIDEVVKSDSETAGRLREIKRSNEEILKTYSPEYIAGQVIWRHEQGAMETKKTPEKRGLFLKPGFRFATIGAVAVVVLAIGFQVFTNFFNTATITGAGEKKEHILLKGEADIKIYRKLNEGFEELKPGDRAVRGDKIQISYRAGNQEFGTIFSIDGNGMLTLHFPDNMEQLPVLDRKGEIPLEFSYELDDAPEFERFFFVTSAEKFNVEDILESASHLALDRVKVKNTDLKITGELQQTSFLLEKGE